MVVTLVNLVRLRNPNNPSLTPTPISPIPISCSSPFDTCLYILGDTSIITASL
jgi:hypothetical protein